MDSESVVQLYASLGSKQYAGEAVNQIEHASQCGRLAANAGVGPSLQLAAWLHDIGHLIADLPGSPSADGIDDGHEYLGAAALKKIWGDEVAEPVRLHVLAKRFLVTTKAAYRDKLSADSIRSLALQGGPMGYEELIAFRANPYGEQAVAIRVWDDLAKLVQPRGPLSLNEQLTQLRLLITAVPQVR